MTKLALNKSKSAPVQGPCDTLDLSCYFMHKEPGFRWKRGVQKTFIRLSAQTFTLMESSKSFRSLVVTRWQLHGLAQDFRAKIVL
jgi:hypothetical protein